MPATVMLPRELSYWKVTAEDSLTSAMAKPLMTSLLVVLFFAVMMVTVKLSPASMTFSKLPLVPEYAVPSIFSWLTEVAVQLNDSFALLPLSL